MNTIRAEVLAVAVSPSALFVLRPSLVTGGSPHAVLKGGQLLAAYGKGHYRFTGYAWFRQFPAGVPGAYRLFAILSKLRKAWESLEPLGDRQPDEKLDRKNVAAYLQQGLFVSHKSGTNEFSFFPHWIGVILSYLSLSPGQRDRIFFFSRI